MTRDRLAVVLVFLATLAFYLATLAPTVLWADSAAFAREVLVGTLVFGGASDHPLYIAIGKLLHRFIPIEVGLLLNLESAVFGAFAVTMVYRCGRQLGASRAAAAVGAGALAVSHAFWLHAVIAEVYTANAFFLATTISLLLAWKEHDRPWYLVAAAVVLAIGLTNHLVLAAMAPAIVVYVLGVKPQWVSRRNAAVVAALVIVVALLVAFVPPLTVQFRRVWYGPPSIWEFFSPSIEPGTGRELAYYFLLLVYQFPSVALVFAALGIAAVGRHSRPTLALLLLTVAVNAAFFIHHAWYPTPGTQKFVFYITDYVVFAMFGAVGAEVALKRVTSGSSRAWAITILLLVTTMPPAIYAAIPAFASRAGIDLVGGRRLPYRDNASYFMNPNKRGETGARRFATEALQTAARDAVLFADSTPYEVIRYLQLTEHLRPDVLVRSPEGFNEPVIVRWMYVNGERRPTYLAAVTPDYDMSRLGPYEIRPVGPIFEVRPK